MNYQAPPGNYIQHPEPLLLELLEAIFGKEHSNLKIECGSSHCTWTAKSNESAKGEVVLKVVSEPQAIILTPVGTNSLPRVFEGGPYGGKFNVIMATLYKEEFAIGTEGFFFWIAIGE